MQFPLPQIITRFTHTNDMLQFSNSFEYFLALSSYTPNYDTFIQH